MAFELDSKTAQWLLALQVLSPKELSPQGNSAFVVEQQAARAFENGTRVSPLVQEIYRARGLPVPQYLGHLKVSNQTAAQLYNWNYLNEALKKLKYEIDPETKNLIINGDRPHLAMALRQIMALLDHDPNIEDSLDAEEMKPLAWPAKPVKPPSRRQSEHEDVELSRESLSLSHSEDAGGQVQGLGNPKKRVESVVALEGPQRGGSGERDLVEEVLRGLMGCIKISRQQALTLLEENNKYLAHILVKGVKGEFGEIEQLLEGWFRQLDFIVQQMATQNDMCFFFLQVVKPALLSKSEEVAQWACRLLSRIAHELANRDLLPLAYDWFVREAGGLSTTLLALTRHPKLNQHVVGFILEFSRYNVAEVFTVELKKITNQDQLAYVKFILNIFEPLVEAKQTAEELLSSGAIDYWVEAGLKGAESRESVELRLFCLELLTKIWRGYPLHFEETLDKVGEVMGLIKRGIREGSEVTRYSLLEVLFGLLDEFASKKNPYASVVYKKLTFLFIENHEELNLREFMLRNITHIIRKYQSIPVEIFLEPFVKQIKIKEHESYFLNVFDLEFIAEAVAHPKLRPEVALEFFDLLAKIKLNNHDFTQLADAAMQALLDRFLAKDIFLQYTAKLVKVSLAKFYNTFKHRRTPPHDHERLLAQKRAEIVNFIISLLQRGPELELPFKVEDRATGGLIATSLHEEIKVCTIQVQVQIQRVLGTTHRGIETILDLFPNASREVSEALEAALQREETESNMTSQNSKEGFRFPKLEQKYLSRDRDETSSQQSNISQGTYYSNRTRQEFPQQDYTKFAEEDEKKFLKEHGIGFRKKERTRKPAAEAEVDPRVQEQLARARARKEEEERRRAQEQGKIERRKELLKSKIQKELEQRNLMQGAKGGAKDVEARMVFGENEINEKLLEEEDCSRDISLAEEEVRDCDSVHLVLQRHQPFLRKLFNRYSSSKVGKKDYFDEDNDNLMQLDLVRLCKEKNLEKSKPIIVELLRQSNDKNTKSVSLEGFGKYLEALTVYTSLRDKVSTHLPMGDTTKELLRKMAVGENFKLEENEDSATKSLTDKVRYNPHIELPDGYKKLYERVYEPKRECSFPTKKAVRNDSLISCYEVVQELLYDIFKVHALEEEVRFYEEARVVKKHLPLPPRPARREKEEPVGLLEEREAVPSAKGKRTASNLHRPRVTGSGANLSLQKQNSRPKQRVVNAAQKRKLDEQQGRRSKKQQEEEEFQRRQVEIKKRFEKLQGEKEAEVSKQKEEKLAANGQEEERRRKEKEEKERYRKEQKDKLERYRREREDKDKEEKEAEQAVKGRDDEERREKLKLQMRKEEVKRREEAERTKKEREASEEKSWRKKEEEEKKGKALRENVQKKLEEEKGKYQVQKLYKELLRNISQEKPVQSLFGAYKDELRSLYNYGREYNEYKLGVTDPGLEQRGWNTICQQFDLADPTTANALIKVNQKEKGRPGLNYDDYQDTLLGLAVRQKDLEPDLEHYERAQEVCVRRLEEFLKRLKIPRQKQNMKDYFGGLKNSLKKREEVQVLGPGGEKETWEVAEK